MRTALPECFSGKAEYLVVRLLFTQTPHTTHKMAGAPSILITCSRQAFYRLRTIRHGTTILLTIREPKLFLFFVPQNKYFFRLKRENGTLSQVGKHKLS